MKAISTLGKSLLAVLVLVLATYSAKSQSIALNGVSGFTAGTVCSGGTLSLTFTTTNGPGEGPDNRFTDSITNINGANLPTLYSLYIGTSSSGPLTLISQFYTEGVVYGGSSGGPNAITLVSGYQVTLNQPILSSVSGSYFVLTSIYPTSTSATTGTLISSGPVTINPGAAFVLTSGDGSNNQTVCQGTAINNITYNLVNATGATVSGLPTGVNYNVSGTTLTISGAPTAAAGTYTYTATTTGGACTNTSVTGVINVNGLPTAGITNNTGTTTLTCSTTAISVTATGGVSYSWTGGLGTNATASITAPGTYTVTVTGANGCTSQAGITVNQNTTAPGASITNNTGTTILTCTTASISLTAVGNGSFQWSNGANTANTSVTAASTYTVVVTGANGCTSTASVVITADQTPPTAGITNGTGTTTLTCATTTINLTATGGGTYMWNTGATTAGLAVTAPGTYTVTVTGANGCTATASVVITQNITAPTAGITNGTGTTTLTCATTTINLTATGGVSYAWSTGATTAALAVTAPGTYTVTVTGANGCTATSSVVITQNITAPTPGITNGSGTTTLTCTTPTINLTATGGVSYLWSTGAMTASIAVTTAGTYTVTVTGANGCTATTSVNITLDKTAPTAGITNNTGATLLTCARTSISVTATGGVSYSWTGGLGTSANATITAPGTYTVTVTGANGCTSSASITVTQDNALPTITGTTAICLGGTSQLTGSGVAAASNPWVSSNTAVATVSNTGLVTSVAAGSASISYTNANGCTQTTTVTVTAPPTASVTGAGTATTCVNAAVVVSGVTATGGTISWIENGQGSITSGGTSTTPTYTPAPGDAGQTVTLTMTVNGTGPCGSSSATANYFIVVQGLPTASAGEQTTYNVCANGTVTVGGMSASNGTISWTENGAGSITSGGNTLNPTYTPTAADAGHTVTLTMTVTGSTACGSVTASANVTINVVACAATFTIDRVEPTCYGSTDGKIVIRNIAGGTPPYQISKDNGFSFVPVTDPSLFEFLNLGAGVYNIILKMADGQLQPLSTTSLIGPAPMKATLTTTGTATCSNNAVTLNVSNVQGGSGGPYTLSVDGSAFTSATTYTVTAGVHTVTAKDKNGCTMVVGTVNVAGPLPLSVGNPTVTNVTTFGGSNGSITISSTGGSSSYMYTLTRPGGANTVVNAGTASVSFTNLIAGTYTITVMDNNGCGTAVRTAVVAQPQQSPVPPDLVLGSESSTNVFKVGPDVVSLVYHVSNVSLTNAAQSVVLRITKPAPGYSFAKMSTATYTNAIGTVYTLDNARWTITTDNDQYLELSLNNDPLGQNWLPAQTYIPKHIGITLTRPVSVTAKGEFTVTGTVRGALPDNFANDNSTVHQYTAQ